MFLFCSHAELEVKARREGFVHRSILLPRTLLRVGEESEWSRDQWLRSEVARGGRPAAARAASRVTSTLIAFAVFKDVVEIEVVEITPSVRPPFMARVKRRF
jgi:hypothetical protein